MWFLRLTKSWFWRHVCFWFEIEVDVSRRSSQKSCFHLVDPRSHCFSRPSQVFLSSFSKLLICPMCSRLKRASVVFSGASVMKNLLLHSELHVRINSWVSNVPQKSRKSVEFGCKNFHLFFKNDVLTCRTVQKVKSSSDSYLVCRHSAVSGVLPVRPRHWDEMFAS